MWWYNLGIGVYSGAVKMVSPFMRKAALWYQGRRDIFRKLEQAVGSSERIIWFHAASLGEFEQGRPVMEAVREYYPSYKILLTFFSPSGYEIRRNYSGADWVFYLPADTPRNAAHFLDTVKPEMAVFIKYEFWLNYLAELSRREVPTYIISAVFRPDSIFFRPWGGAFRRALRSFRRLFVQDADSQALLAGIGVTNVTVAGDTRFDRVGRIADGARRLPAVEDFAAGGTVFVAGSTWPPDEEILVRLINANPGMKFIVAPHEMDEKRIKEMAGAVRGGAVRYTEYGEADDGGEKQLLIIDTIGILSSVYGYGSYAYIGGGFGVGIHNTLEAAAFGIPVAFGPNYAKFLEARDLISLGAARSISSYEELAVWLASLQSDRQAYGRAAAEAGAYVRSHRGATEIILRGLFEGQERE